jgi:hypothetical protein
MEPDQKEHSVGIPPTNANTSLNLGGLKTGYLTKRGSGGSVGKRKSW